MAAGSFNRALLEFTTPRVVEDLLEPKLGHAHRSAAVGGGKFNTRLSSGIDKRLGRLRRFGVSEGTSLAALADNYASDPRQRAIVKVHYFTHAGGGGAAMRAHARYINREGVERDQAPDAAETRQRDDLTPENRRGADEVRSQAHAAYLSRDAQIGFYDREQSGVDGAARMAEWSRADTRHFRIVLAPENGASLNDLRSYTREVMERAEQTLGRGQLDWVAVDHWDTDNPHSHIVLRGRRHEGRPLGLPREFVRHGLRDIARDVASERLGPRSPDDQRLALDREVRAHRLTGLDRIIADSLDERGVARMADLGVGIDGASAQRVKSRAVELQRLGLADEVKRGVLHFSPDWRERLNAMELHIDIRKRLMLERTADRAFERAADALSHETGKPFQNLSDFDQTWKVRGIIDLPQGQYLALERYNSVALMAKPRGMDIQPGHAISVQLDRGVAKVRGLGLER